MSGRGLLVDTRSLGARRTIARGALDPLAASLAADLHAAAARPLFVPAEKARLTRVGGRCPVDGAPLGFDPFAPRHHVCPACRRAYDDDAHYRWWIMWYQLWLAERAVHGATLALLRDDVVARTFATQVLAELADRYLSYPNQDNVLGPTRPFFSTYLESIWLLQVCVALDLLELDDRDAIRTLGGRVRERIVEPSRALVAEYDEGRSNRQVWNAAAIAAASYALGEPGGVERALLGPSGVAAHLGDGLLADGTWYEGENYHQFAHRGLWYGVVIAERAGIALPPRLLARFDDGFVAPLLTAYPDLTLPARRDSQWATSLRQWRWAEWCELGFARTDDERLAATLTTLYGDDGIARSDTGRWRTAAESERNEPPTRLTRADLGWKSLLFARADVPSATWTPPSVLLDAQGLAVFRRDGGRRWVGLDYGASGGGHGHPDRLNLLLVDGPRRWLDDMGTGSYVDRSLHWYRSTLAHNAPLVDGRSQHRVDGVLDAYDDDGRWGWAHATATIAPGVVVRRAVVVGPSYVVDRIEWSADRVVTFDLPLHMDAIADDARSWTEVSLVGAGRLEDGFDGVTAARVAPVDAHTAVRLRAPAARAVIAPHSARLATSGDHECRAWITPSLEATLIRAAAPGAPGMGTREFQIVRMHASRGVITSVWDTSARVEDVVVSGDDARPEEIVVRHADGRTADTHSLTERRWHVATRRGGLHSQHVLGGARSPRSAPGAPPAHTASGAGRQSSPRYALTDRSGPLEFALGEINYRRTEQTWHDAERPSARVIVSRTDAAIIVETQVRHRCPTFVPQHTENPLDTERAEVNADGVQLYLQAGEQGEPHGDAMLGWLLMPVAEGDAVRAIALSPRASSVRVRATWRREPLGYAIVATIPLDAIGGRRASSFAFDVVVNETTPLRERRRGQLVLSGARGEFAYLQGDRHDAARLVAVDLIDTPAFS